MGSLIVLLASSLGLAADLVTEESLDQFPQSARVARDRRADAVWELARIELERRNWAAAVVAIQELLDGPKTFVSDNSRSPSLMAEAQRFLRLGPAALRDSYERSYGAEANRLWQEARDNGSIEGLRTVVSRFGMTRAGWFALRDIAARHADRGEWELAAAASVRLAEHPYSAIVNDRGWIARWILAEARLAGTRGSATELWTRYRARLEAAPAPAAAQEKNLGEWLKHRLPSSVTEVAATPEQRWRSALALAPAEQPVWQHHVKLESEAAQWLQDIVAEWKAYDVAMLPCAQPLVVGDIVIARFAQPAKLVAVDARQGKLLWEQSLPNALGSTFTDLQRHPGLRTSLVDELQRRWFGDSVRGRLTTDGQRLFLVRDLDELDLKPGAGARLRNHLEAYDLATGERLWRVGSSVNEPPTGFEGLYFLGPPLASDGWLYVIAQRELQVSLCVLRASDGQFAWTLPLAETDRQQFQENGWRHIGCPVTWASGRLICPTGAGCFVAVDPVSRSTEWALRFERDDITNVTGFVAADRERPFLTRWWESWREVECRELSVRSREPDESLQSLLLIASPESRSLRAIDPLTGELRWRASFHQPLFFAAKAHTAMVFERDRITGLDPRGGAILWTSDAREPAGPGDWIDADYLFPGREGSWRLIDSRTGELRSSLPPRFGVADHLDDAGSTQVSGGRLVRAAGRWLTQSPTRLLLHESLALHREQWQKQLTAEPDNVDAMIGLARIAQQLGDWSEAEKLLRNQSEPDARISVAWREHLRHRLASEPQAHRSIHDELLRLSSGVAQEPLARRALIEAARRDGDTVATLRHLLRWLELQVSEDLRREQIVIEHPAAATRPMSAALRRTVRADRWAQGLIADSLAQADDATRAELDRLLTERRQQAMESTDPFALQALAEQLANLPLGRDLRLQLSGRTSSGVGYLPTSLALRDIAQSSDRIAAAQAWYRLALLHEFRSEPREAADCYRELRDRYADITAADGRGTSNWLAEIPPDSPVGRALSSDAADSWPTNVAKITSESEPRDDVYNYIVPVETRDPHWRRITVSVERQGRKVRFHGGGQRGFWDLPLPASKSPFRHAVEMHRGWAFGPLLVLQVGDDLFGIQPLDERGETNARLLWTISVGPFEEIGAHQYLPGRIGVRADDFVFLDLFEQPILDVVLATPGLVCYRTRNRLIAIDPATGERLWIRHGLPPLTAVTGDSEQVVVELIADRELEIRRGFDGQLLARRPEDVDRKRILFDSGRRRLLLEPIALNDDAAGLRLRCDDLVAGEISWQQSLPPNSTVLRVDELRVGVLEPRGVLRFLSLADGQELARHEVAVPTPLTAAHVIGDDTRLFVALSGPVIDRNWLNIQQDRGGYRKPLINGWLLAFDRRSLKWLWSLEAKNLPFALEQPLDSPFLVLSYKQPETGVAESQTPDAVLHLIDKRSGKELFREVVSLNEVAVNLEPDAVQNRIDLLTPKRRLRVEFSSAE